MALHLTRRRFTVSEYHRMADAGILDEDDRVELIDGEVVEMTPIGSRHAACVARLTRLLLQLVGDAAVVWAQNPIDLGEHSEPQPDVVLLKPRADFYSAGHPTPDDIFLLIEVGESSAAVDRRVKAPLYARSGIPEAWLVDLEQETVTLYRDPSPDGYRTAQVFRRGESVAPTAFPGHTLVIDEILG